MKIAKMINNIWATHKGERLVGLKLLPIQPLDVLTGKTERPPIVATNIIGAGVGRIVLTVRGNSARSAAGDMNIPVDATVAGIVDGQETGRSVLP